MSDGEQNIQSGRDTTQAGRDVTKIGGDKVGGDKYSPLHQRRAPVPDFVGRAEEIAQLAQTLTSGNGHLTRAKEATAGLARVRAKLADEPPPQEEEEE